MLSSKRGRFFALICAVAVIVGGALLTSCKQNGQKTQALSDGTVLDGTFNKGNFVSGTMKKPNGTVYEGAFRDGYITSGTMKKPNGTVYEGEFSGDYITSGKMTVPGEYVAQGTFQNGLLNGDKCTVTFDDGTVWKGKFSNGDIAKGTITSSDKTVVCDGTFEDNKLHGDNCRMDIPDGAFEGTFKNGRIYTGKFTYSKGVRGTLFSTVEYENGEVKNKITNAIGSALSGLLGAADQYATNLSKNGLKIGG